MWWIFPVSLITIAIGFGIWFMFEEDDFKTFFGLSFLALSILSLFVFGVMAIVNKIGTSESEVKLINTKPLYAFVDNSNKDIKGGGNIFLWKVQSGTTYEYRFVTMGNKGKVIKTENADNVEIADNEINNIRLESYGVEIIRTSSFWKFMYGDCCVTDEKYKVAYIPPNSISTDFKIDLE
jgi:hypothetical protein